MTALTRQYLNVAKDSQSAGAEASVQDSYNDRDLPCKLIESKRWLPGMDSHKS